MNSIQIRFSVAVLLMVLAATPAYPQKKEDIFQLMKDMIDMQQLVRQLQTSVDRDNSVMKGLMEKMADQVNTLAGSLQRMNQSVDGLKTQNDASTRELRTILTTMNGNVKELEEGLSSARAQISTVSREMTSIKTTATPLPTADDDWKAAKLDTLLGNWSIAVAELQDFTSKYPNDPHAADAQLLLGDAFVAQKKYDQAITQYDIVLQKYPDSDTTRAALLKKGLAQAEANQPQARDTLNEVIKKFPNTSEANTAGAKLKELQPPQRGKAPAR